MGANVFVYILIMSATVFVNFLPILMFRDFQRHHRFYCGFAPVWWGRRD